MARVLLVCVDHVGPALSGWGVRMTETARVLDSEHEVMLAAPHGSEMVSGLPDPLLYTWSEAKPLIDAARSADVVVCPPLPPEVVQRARRGKTAWIFDLLCPALFEGLEQTRSHPRTRRQLMLKGTRDATAVALLTGNFFICGSERQRDMWLGALLAQGRVDSRLYDLDPTLRNLIDVVPLGVPTEPCTDEPGVVKGSWPGIPSDSKLLLWGGGLWDWLDPLTPIRAMSRLARDRPDIKLFFMGTRRPGGVPPMAMTEKALKLADDLNLKGHSVFFNDAWVPYNERGRYLNDADVAISTDLDRIETRFSFRTRILDYIWAGLPLVSSEGDTLSDRMAAAGAAQIIKHGDDEAAANAIVKLADTGRESLSEEFNQLRESLRWDVVTRPLLNFLGESAHQTSSTRRGRDTAAMIAAPHMVARPIRTAISRLARSRAGPDDEKQSAD